MNASLILRNVRAYAPEDLGTVDIAIENGKIAAITAPGALQASSSLDCAGLIALPGVIETHAHMLLPFGGTQTNNNFFDGTRSGAFGGVTTLIDFADQTKGGSIRAALESRLATARAQCATDYGFHCTLTDLTEETLREIPALIDEGFTSFKFYTAYKAGGLFVPYDAMERAFAVIARHGGIATVHAEQEDIVSAATERLLQAGKTDCRHFLQSRPTEAETAAIDRLIALSEQTGARVLVRHVSSAAGARRIVRAQKRGVEIYGETCPHYLYFDESVYTRENAADYLVNPPIRTAEDREGLWQALESGAAFTIGTDDCAFNLAQKRVSDRFCDIPGGMPGIETRLVLLYELGVRTGRISLSRLAELTAETPARLYGIYPQKGRLAAGCDADIVLLDPNAHTTLTASNLHERADYTPYEGMELHVAVAKTFSRGRLIVDGAQDFAVPGEGKLLKRGLPVSAIRCKI